MHQAGHDFKSQGTISDEGANTTIDYSAIPRSDFLVKMGNAEKLIGYGGNDVTGKNH